MEKLVKDATKIQKELFSSCYAEKDLPAIIVMLSRGRGIFRRVPPYLFLELDKHGG